jgi:type IV pilus assembly protein PilA
MLKLTKRGFDKGVTLIELLVTIMIVGILASIAIPVVTNYQSEAFRNKAVSDGSAWKSSVTLALLEFTDYGTGGFMKLTNSGNGAGTLTFTLGTNPTPVGKTPETIAVGISEGSELVHAALKGKNWCFAVRNNGQYAVFTQLGLRERDKRSCNTTDATASTDAPPATW